MSAEAYLDAVLSIWADRRERTTTKLSGNSMAPLLRHGDLLVIEHGSGNVRVGDVIVFKCSGKLLVHRLVRRRRTHAGAVLMAKGDRNRVFDSPIRADQVIGKVVGVQGPDRQLRLNSRFWIPANYFLARLSRVAAMNARAGSAIWRALRLIDVLQSFVVRQVQMARWRGGGERRGV